MQHGYWNSNGDFQSNGTHESEHFYYNGPCETPDIFTLTVDGEEYEVESVLDERPDGAGGTEYRVRWDGYGPADDTWEPLENLGDAQDAIAEFEKPFASWGEASLSREISKNGLA